MDKRDSRQAEVVSNYQAFLADFPALAINNKGQYAVYRHQQFIKAFESFSSALSFATETYDDRLFSIQEVTGEPLSLGGLIDASDTVTL